MKKILLFSLFLMFFLNINYLYATQYDYKGDCVWHPSYKKLNECLDKELVEYDSKLNVLYSKLYSGDASKKLKKTELLWIRFKETDCDYIASEVNYGKDYTYIYKACLINKTKERIDDLRRSYAFFGWIRGMY
ncbi:MAG: lysozyme inhibitor LprI family protein [Erysipelotrichaceae bacterium]